MPIILLMLMFVVMVLIKSCGSETAPAKESWESPTTQESEQPSIKDIRKSQEDALNDALNSQREADNAIRENNASMRAELEQKAVAHRKSAPGAGDTSYDVYQLPDGRIITCTTTVYSNGAPIMQCDGEP